ncbi:MAG: hypothetical protein PHS49_01260 [Candidatus Gracilibacteria bacterium]|nr:hypothetical protein [Candidatus Gracilibacteria bacterium]
MKNVIKNSFYTAAGIALLSFSTASAAINPGQGVNDNLRTVGTADTVVQIWLGNLLTFLYLVAVLLGIWGGFNILTAAGDEEKVKKGKTILLQAIGGIVVIFLAGSIIDWLLTLIVGQ